MLNLKTIQEQLINLPWDYITAFTVRVTMKALPLLINKFEENKTLWFWNDEKFLLAILHAQRSSFAVAACGAKLDSIHIIADAARNASDAARNASDAARNYNTEIHPYGAHIDDDAVAYEAACAASDLARAIACTASTAANAHIAAIYAAGYAAEAIEKVIESDLHALYIQANIHSEWDLIKPKKYLDSKNKSLITTSSEYHSALEYLTQPLWLSKPPEFWQVHWRYFKLAVLSVNTRFMGFLDWF